jgi:hypothetical protein
MGEDIESDSSLDWSLMNANGTSLPVRARNGDGLPQSDTEILTACFPHLAIFKELRGKIYPTPIL